MSNRVAGLCAGCDLERAADDGRTVSFSVREFAVLADGRRALLRGGLGFTMGWGSGVGTTAAVWDGYTLDAARRDVLNVVLPDDDDTGEDHPWEWLAELARQQGLAVTADDLRGLPYTVELSYRVHRLLSPA